MAIGEERQQRREETAAVDKFPAGRHVLAVDDDRVSLKVLEVLLRHCNYHVTTATHAETALQMLREGKGQYDLVITDVHMPDMDGFELLELIGLEMDIPVIMLSADGEKETVTKGIFYGACDYLVKPVQAKELKYIWQHAVRRRSHHDPRNHINGGNGAADRMVHRQITEGGSKTTRARQNYSRRRRNDNEDSNKNEKNNFLSTQKKPRVIWTKELHERFLQAINWVGIDKAIPKNIFETMNVSYITRECVASHLQKYRLYLKKVSGYTGRRSYVVDDTFKRWNSNHTMNDHRSYKHHHEHGSSSSSGNLFARMSSPPASGSHGNASNNLPMRAVVHDGSMLMDARKFSPFGPHIDSCAHISNGTLLYDDNDGDDELPPCHPGNSYANILRGKLLEASKVIHHHNRKSSENAPSDAVMSVSVNKFPVQSPQLGNQPSTQIYGTPKATMGNCSRSRQTMVPTEFPDLHNIDGSSASLGTSLVNIPEINQIASTQMLNSASVAGILPVLQENIIDQVALDDQLDNNNEALGDQLDNNNEALGGQLDYTNQAFDNQLDNNNEALGDQVNNYNDFLTGTDVPDGSSSFDEMIANLLVNQDFMQDGAFMDKDWFS